MANSIENKVAYTTATHPEWFIGAIKGANSLDKGYFRVVPKVIKDVLIKKLVISGNTVSQGDNRDCNWTPSQRMKAEGKVITVKNFKINEEQCLDQLDSVYSESIFAGANKTEMPEDLYEAAMSLVQKSLAADLDRIIWGGENNTIDGSQGIIDKALADNSTIKVDGTTLDNTNILTEIQKVYNAIPDAVISEGLYDPEKAVVRIFVNMSGYRHLLQALTTTPTGVQVTLPSYTLDNGVVRYLGVEIVPIAYLPDNYMFAASKDNLVFATDLLSDTQEFGAETGASLKDRNIMYIKGQYRASADYIFSDEVVIYKPE